MAFVKRTQDGKKVGLEVIEIVSFPNLSEISSYNQSTNENATDFLDLVKSFRSVYRDNRAVFEILWYAKPVQGQAYNSEVKVFIVLREIGLQEEYITSNLNRLCGNICTFLKLKRYVVKVLDSVDTLKRTLISIDTDCVFALKKQEKYAVNYASQSALYYSDVLADRYESLDLVISSMSELSDCAISFQIFPEELTMQEKMAINEAYTVYSGLANGDVRNRGVGNSYLQDLMLQSITSYYGAMDNSLYGYNILVLGKKIDASILLDRVCSLLKDKENNIISVDKVDLSSSSIRLYKDFFVYPWNIYSYIYKSCSRTPCMNSSHLLFRKLCMLMSNMELLNFFRLPFGSNQNLSLKSEDLFYISEQVSDSLLLESNIKFGFANTVSGRLELGCPPEHFAKHALIVGTPGTGKTTFSLNLLLQFYRHGVPFLAIEPTKTEYRALISKIPDIQIFTPGNNEISPFIINPFVPPKGIKVEQYIPALLTAFGAAFDMESPLDVIFLKAVRTAYTQYGWKDYSQYGDSGTREFGLYEFILVFKRILKDSTYGKEVKANIEQAGTYRLLKLIEENGNIYDTLNNIPVEDILTKPTIIELNAIQDETQKSLVMSLLLTTICLHIKLIQSGDGKLKNIILIDEAHVLLSDGTSTGNSSNPKGKTISAIKSMIAEVRSYGTGIIIADQSAKMVSREVVANTDIKIVFRLVESEEKEIVGNSINADDRIREKMSALKMGEAFIFLSKLEKPQLVVTPDIRKLEDISLVVSNDFIAEKMKYWDAHINLLKPYRECRNCTQQHCDYYVRSDANYHARRILLDRAKEIKDKSDVFKYLKGLDIVLGKVLSEVEEEKKSALIICTMIQFRRVVQLETDIRITDDEFIRILKIVKEEIG